MDSKEKKNNYTFIQVNSFIDFDLISLVLAWSFSGFLIYTIICHPSGSLAVNTLAILTAVAFIFHPTVFRDTYYRWIYFKYNKNTAFSVNTKQKIFTYKHDNQIINFTPNDIEKWWMYDYGLIISSTFCIDIIEFYLKNGKKVIVSSEMIDGEGVFDSNGYQDAVHFVYYNWKELGLPKEYFEERHEKAQSFRAYMKEIAGYI